MENKSYVPLLDVILFGLLIAMYLVISQLAWLVPQSAASDAFLMAGMWRLIYLPIVRAVLIIALIGYVGADVIAGRYTYSFKLCIAWFAIAIISILTALAAVYMRHTTVPYLYVHDGLIQTEEAAKFLLSGKNPYVENYVNTPMSLWTFNEPNLSVNPALYHFAYLPFLIWTTVPFYLVSNAVLGWFDLRFLFIFLFVITLLLMNKLVYYRENKLALLLFVGLNPLFVLPFVEGRNDVFVLFWLVLSLVLLRNRHKAMSLCAFALACASKQTVWFMMPFYLVYFLQLGQGVTWSDTLRNALAKFKRELRLFAIAPAIFGLSVLPFLLWNMNAFVDDVFRYPAGLGDQPYPIRSIGLGDAAIALGWVPNNLAPFPFGWLQLIFGLPALAALCGFQLKHNTLARLWFCYALFLFIISFFSNVFNDNHFGFIITLFAIGAFCQAPIDERSAGDES